MDIPVLYFWFGVAGVAIVLLPVAVALLQKPRPPALAMPQTSPAVAPSKQIQRSGPTLEEQIAALHDAGLPLNSYVTIDDLLFSWPREEYEDGTYTSLLFMYGVELEREPLGRHVSAHAWNFDTECITGPGSYVEIVKEFARIAGATDLITNITDKVDMNAPTATLSYTVSGEPRTLTIQLNHDWADPDAVTTIMQDIEKAVGDGRRFRGMDNGQASVWFFLKDEAADKVNAITGGLLVY